MKASITVLAIAAVIVFFTGCSENPAAVEDHEDLSVELTMSSDHVHTLTPVTFTVAVRDDHGRAVIEFDTLRVERLFEGTDTWRATDLTRTGDVFTGEYTFRSSGEYHLRVAGRTHDHDDMEVMHEMHDPISVGRAHEVAGGYRVEFETFPGHIHDGDEATVKFWVMDEEKNANGVRPPIENLGAVIHCQDATGKREEHSPAETEPGVYETTHTFEGGGEAHMELNYPGKDGQEVTAEFHLDVAHGH